MSLDDMSDANGRRSTPASMTDEHPTPIQAQIKDINLSDSKTKKNVLTNQTDIFGLLDMSPPERKKNPDLNPEVVCFQPSEQTSATGSQHSGSPPRLTTSLAGGSQHSCPSATVRRNESFESIRFGTGTHSIERQAAL